MELTKEQVKEAIASYMKEPTQRKALAEILVEYINPTHITTDFVSLLLNTKVFKPGDIMAKKLRKGIKVYSHVPGSVPLKSEITLTDRANYIFDTGEVALHANVMDLESGELGTIDEMKNEAMLQVRDFYMNRVFTALSTIWSSSNTPNNYTSVGGALNATALKSAIDRVNQTTSGAKAIIGTRKALTPITTFGASWSDGTSNMRVPENITEIMQTGWLGRYYGVPVIALNQQWDNPEDYNELIPSDKVLVIGENVGDFVTFSGNYADEYIDHTTMPAKWVWQTMFNWGMIIDNAMGIYLLDDIS